LAVISSNSNATQAKISSSAQRTDIRAMTLVTTLFFMWGFLTVLNDILIPYLRHIFTLNYGEVMLVQFSFFSSYFIFSVPYGKLVEKIGYKRTMIAGLCTMGMGGLFFLPAASVPSFPLFLLALIVLASGMTALQVSANPYVTALGPAVTASSRLNLAQGFNSLGTALAPFIGSMLILPARSVTTVQSLPEGAALAAYRAQQAATVKLPYLGFALILFLLAGILAFSHLPSIVSKEQTQPKTFWSLFRRSRLTLAALGIFLYVGAEVAIGSFLVNYISLPAIGHVSEQVAAGYVSFYWSGAMIGRFLGSALLRTVKPWKVLLCAAVLALALVLASITFSGTVALISILLVGLANSVMFPCIFAGGIEGLGERTGEGSGILIAAIVGGAVIPELQGILADHIGVHHSFLVSAACYVFVAAFAFGCLRFPVAPVSSEL
jgi:FHS family L-fucose permease-like MFS transporter